MAQGLKKNLSFQLSSSPVEAVWPSQEVRDFREQCNGCHSGLIKEGSSHLVNMKARSLHKTNKLTVKMSDVEAGLLDIAELRSDGSGCFYSNFTAQGFDLPRCLDKCTAIHRIWSFTAFALSALHQLLFNTEALAMTISGGLSTFVCSENVVDFRATYQTSAIFIGLIFPLVFLISQTWARREKAVERLATIKANAVQLVLKMVVNADGGAVNALKVIECTRALIDEIGKYLPQDSKHSGLRLSSIYGRFADLQAEPECAMLTRFMVVEFEKLRTQRDYRTPWKLNYFCFLFGSISPVLCGPLFASMGCQDRFPARTSLESCGYGTPGAYLSAFFFALVISSLLSVVKAMEDPFSLSGPDDVIASFSFEANALLHLIEDRKPGTLKAGPQPLRKISSGSEPPVSPRTQKAEQDHKRHDETRKQGAVDAGDDDEDAGGGGMMG